MQIRIFFILSFMFFVGFHTQAQKKYITGRVVDAYTRETLIGAHVLVVDHNYGTVTDVTGSFVLEVDERLSQCSIEIRYVGYETVIRQIHLTDNKIYLEIFVQPQSSMLDAVDIISTMDMSKQTALLVEQQNASKMVEFVGAEEMSRKGTSDVAKAVTKVAGVSASEGDNIIYFRGLGDRYNSTQLNGLPVPSNDPELKNIALDLFTSDIVEYIAIEKVYNNAIYGDFAGGNVNICTKRLKEENYNEVNVGTSFHNKAITANPFNVKDENYSTLFRSYRPELSLTEYPFKNSADSRTALPIGTAFGLTSRKYWRLGGNRLRELGVFATAQYGNKFVNYTGPIYGTINSSGVPNKILQMDVNNAESNFTSILNLGFRFNQRHTLNYNFFYITSINDVLEKYTGTIMDIADYDNGLLMRKVVVRNALMVQQLLGSHIFSKKSQFQWALAYNTVRQDLPDRIQNTFRMDNGQYFFAQNQISDNHRYMHFLNEQEVAVNTAYIFDVYQNTMKQQKLQVTFGSTSRYKFRIFEAAQLNFRIRPTYLAQPVDVSNLDAFFNDEHMQNGAFTIETFRGNYMVPFALDPQVYKGTQLIGGVYGNIEYSTKNMTYLIGLRQEYLYQDIEWNTQLDPTDRMDYFEYWKFLPSLMLKYNLKEKQNIRFAASRTYTLPQFKERALFLYEDVTQVKIGNPDLYPSDNYNVDLKWEYFPQLGELFSVALFGKYIANPINEFVIASATHDISYVNSGNWGYLYGIETEMRKKIYEVNRAKMMSGWNITYMNTEQELNAEKVQEETMYRINFTNEKAPFTGSASLLANADVSLIIKGKEDKRRWISTLVYSYASERLYAIGTNGLGNIYEKPYHSFDALVKYETETFSTHIKFRNIMNTPIERYQRNSDGDYLVVSYKKGILAEISLAFRF